MSIWPNRKYVGTETDIATQVWQWMDHRPRTTDEIAEFWNMNVADTERVMVALLRAGKVRSSKYSCGGYWTIWTKRKAQT